MCARTDCTTGEQGDWAPVIVLKIRDTVTGERFRIPAILGIRVCRPCRKNVEAEGPDKILKDERAFDALLQLRPNARLVAKTLEWISTDSVEFKMLSKENDPN